MSSTYDAALAALDPGSISSMTPQEAGAKLAELGAAYRNDVPIAEVMRSQPTDAVGAHRKLQALMDNPEWRNLHAARNPGALKDFQTLTEMIANASEADFAVVGVRPAHHINTNAGASLDDQISAAGDMRARGLTVAGVSEWLRREGIEPSALSNETAIHSILSDKKPSPATHEAGRVEQARLMGDKDFLALLDAGDPWARTHFLIVSWAVGCYGP